MGPGAQDCRSRAPERRSRGRTPQAAPAPARPRNLVLMGIRGAEPDRGLYAFAVSPVFIL